jgi:peptidoglycan hydrolase-like protein with peptidoglycan-binding domain
MSDDVTLRPRSPVPVTESTERTESTVIGPSRPVQGSEPPTPQLPDPAAAKIIGTEGTVLPVATTAPLAPGFANLRIVEEPPNIVSAVGPGRANSESDVLAVQKLLNHHFQGNPSISLDGVFGDETEQAILRYQQEMKTTGKLTVADGVVDPLPGTTLTLLRAEAATNLKTPPEDRAPPPESSSSAGPKLHDRASFLPQVGPLEAPLALGSSGDNVVTVKKSLLERGLLANQDVNSSFDATTKQAVSKYQQQEDEPVKGVVDDRTWALLSAVNIDPSSVDLVQAFVNVTKQRPDIFNKGQIDAEGMQIAFSDISRLTGRTAITLGELVGHLMIIYNETGGRFRPVSERGSLQYLFEPKAGVKTTYNKAPNRLAGDQLTGWALLTEAERAAWNGPMMPAGVPADPQRHAAVIAKLPDCDFNKCRGRGLNQVTWLSGYQKYVDPVLQPLLGKTSEGMTNAEVDAAFQDPRVYCSVFRNYTRDPSWADQALATLVRGDYSQYPLRVAGMHATEYQQLFEHRAAAFEAELLRQGIALA